VSRLDQKRRRFEEDEDGPDLHAEVSRAVAQVANMSQGVSALMQGHAAAQATAHTSVVNVNATPQEVRDGSAVITTLFTDLFTRIMAEYEACDDLDDRIARLNDLQTAVENACASGGVQGTATMQAKAEQVSKAPVDKQLLLFQFLFKDCKPGDMPWPWSKAP